jgi:hypothetical protein
MKAVLKSDAMHGGFRDLGVDGDGVKEDFHFDEATGEITIARTYMGHADPFAQLEKNKQEQIDNPKNQTKDKTFRKVASIPLAVVEMWTAIYGVDPTAKGNEPLLNRLLNDPDWRWLRTDTGRVKLRGF